ncbi:YceI family protein [Trinickia sp.]|uniref:YceI family protein n=1 Tax=Trinickia sp. TaxID=2571163 RepID=UPI003F81DD08
MVQAAPAAGAPAAYGLRPETSSVRFTIASPRGWRWRMRFVRMNGRLERGRDTREFGRVSVDIDARSVESNTPFAAAFVKSSAVLDTARYPSIRFVSTGYIPTGEGKGRLLGLLTIRAVTQPIELDVTFDDSIVRSGAQDRLAFRASGNFSRGAFGLAKWASSIDDDIPLQIEGEFARVSPPSLD